MKHCSSPLLTEYRSQLRELLASLGLRCPVRRCADPSYLLSLPLFLQADADTAGAFLTWVSEAGWESRERDGWLLMRRPVPRPEVWEEPAMGDGATGALLSLLKRHPGGPEPDRETVYALLKAGEEGPRTLEREAARLHGVMAEKLRLHGELPDLYPYLCGCLEGRK